VFYSYLLLSRVNNIIEKNYYQCTKTDQDTLIEQSNTTDQMLYPIYFINLISKLHANFGNSSLDFLLLSNYKDCIMTGQR